MLSLRLLPGEYAVCRLPPHETVPSDMWSPGDVVSVTRTPRETSVVCREDRAPSGGRIEPGWRVLEVAGPLDFELTGILASLTVPLAEAGVSVFALSTYDTDYLLVRSSSVERGADALRAAGHEVIA